MFKLLVVYESKMNHYNTTKKVGFFPIGYVFTKNNKEDVVLPKGFI